MATKPGDTRTGPTGGTLIWTGRAWVPLPKLKAQQVALRKKIAEAQQSQTTSSNPLGINRPSVGDPERSWKSRGSMSGTVSSGVSKGNKDRPAVKPSVTSGTVSSAISSASKPSSKVTSKPVLLGAAYGKKKPTSTQSKPSTSRPSSSGSASQAGGGRKPSVSQSRTMWVKKGTVVDGKAVQKGYLAQYGKPAKKVTARVRAEKGNAAGMKAGSVTQYKAGRKVKRGK